jgi:hypothetical protein
MFRFVSYAICCETRCYFATKSCWHELRDAVGLLKVKR